MPAADGDVLDFWLLGPLQARSGGQDVPVTSPKHRVLLATLLLRAGRPVSADELVEAIWDGSDPPANPRRTVQLYAARLRELFASRGQPAVIATWADGYRADVRPEQTDLGRFQWLLDEADKAAARSALDAEASLLTRALEQWHGEPLADVPSELLQRETVPRLAEQRLQAQERLFDAELRRRRHAEITGELIALTARYPLRERLWTQLVTALHRSGHRSEALRGYHAIRQALAAELGVAPGDELQAAHALALADEPAAAPVPRQLPADVPLFTGRAAELAWLDSQLPGQPSSSACASPAAATEGTWEPMRLVLITGMGGVGKTALAAHWARRHADYFFDGQLWLNLRGFSPGQAVAPEQALRRLLRSLGSKDAEIPLDADEAAALYRSRTDGRKILIVLDNAASADQVRPLLPGAPGSMVVVTSRSQLTGLVAAEGALPLRLGLPSADEARRMLAARLGTGRLTSEPAAVDEIVALCARLPLALGLAGTRAATRPGFSLGALADELRAAQGSLDAFAGADQETEVRAVFAWSYASLTAPAARLFRLLSQHPGPDFGPAAAASLADVPAATARPLLRELADASMLTEPVPGRYGFHDLLRAYAAELAAGHDPVASRTEARHRALHYYLHSAYAAVRALHPYPDPGVPAHHPAIPVQWLPRVITQSFPRRQDALAWLAAEQAALRAAIRQTADDQPALAWQLTWPLADYQMRQGLWHDAVTTLRAKLNDAHGGQADKAAAHRGLARAYLRLGRPDAAQTHGEMALRLAIEADDQEGTALAHRTLGKVHGTQGMHHAALRHDMRALRLFTEAGDQAGKARALNAVGWRHTQLGAPVKGLRYCEHALKLLTRIGDGLGEAAAWDSLGLVWHRLGQQGQALAAYERALGLFRDLGDRYEEASTLTRAGDVHLACGEADEACAAWEDALAIYTELGHSAAASTRAKLFLRGNNPPRHGVSGEDARRS